MTHIFLEFTDIDPGVKSVNDLAYVLKDESAPSVFVISPEVVEAFRAAITFNSIMNKPLMNFKNCNIAFKDGAECVEIDGKGKLKQCEGVPDWLPSKSDFMRSNWLENHQLHDLITPQFIDAFLEKFPSVKERRDHANYLFDLQLDKMKGVSVAASYQPASKVGNKNSRSTKPKIIDIGSFELFAQFFDRLKAAVESDNVPDLEMLVGMPVNKAPNNLRSGIRTWFKAIVGDLLPNNKKLQAIKDNGTESLYCAPIREKLDQVEAIGLEKFYQALSQAVRESDGYITDFEFKFPD